MGYKSKEMDKSVTSTTSSLSDWYGVKVENKSLSVAEATALRLFVDDYPGRKELDMLKLSLAQKLQEAKEIGSRVTRTKTNIAAIQQQLQIYENEGPNEALCGLCCQLESERHLFKELLEMLRNLKSETNHLHHSLRKKQVQLLRDFNDWWNSQQGMEDFRKIPSTIDITQQTESTHEEGSSSNNVQKETTPQAESRPKSGGSIKSSSNKSNKKPVNRKDSSLSNKPSAALESTTNLKMSKSILSRLSSGGIIDTIDTGVLPKRENDKPNASDTTLSFSDNETSLTMPISSNVSSGLNTISTQVNSAQLDISNNKETQTVIKLSDMDSTDIFETLFNTSSEISTYNNLDVSNKESEETWKDIEPTHKLKDIESTYIGKDIEITHKLKDIEPTHKLKDIESTYIGKDIEITHKLKDIGKDIESTHIGKDIESTYIGKDIESTYIGKDIESTYIGKDIESTYIGKGIESTHIGKDIESTYIGKGIESTHIRNGIEFTHKLKDIESTYVGEDIESTYIGKDIESTHTGKHIQWAVPNVHKNTVSESQLEESDSNLSISSGKDSKFVGYESSSTETLGSTLSEHSHISNQSRSSKKTVNPLLTISTSSLKWKHRIPKQNCKWKKGFKESEITEITLNIVCEDIFDKTTSEPLATGEGHNIEDNINVYTASGDNNTKTKSVQNTYNEVQDYVENRPNSKNSTKVPQFRKTTDNNRQNSENSNKEPQFRKTTNKDSREIKGLSNAPVTGDQEADEMIQAFIAARLKLMENRNKCVKK